MNLPSDRAVTIGRAFRDQITLYAVNIQCDATNVRYDTIYYIAKRDAEGLIWLCFPTMPLHRRIAARMTLNGLIDGLGLRRRYRFQLAEQGNDLYFTHRVSVDDKWTHAKLTWDQWVPVAEGNLAAMLARSLMTLAHA